MILSNRVRSSYAVLLQSNLRVSASHALVCAATGQVQVAFSVLPLTKTSKIASKLAGRSLRSRPLCWRSVKNQKID